jgi:hypothetical protein
MKTKNLWLTWLYLFAFCCIIGFVPEPPGLIKGLFLLAAVAFFIPGVMLLHQEGKRTAKRIVLISAASLVCTTVTVILNFASVLLEDVWGIVLHILMGIVSTPMLCSQIWVISLFGWACLLMLGIFKLLKK